MGSQVSVYNLGEMGVNTTKSAVHLSDGELTKAQNMQTDPAGEAGAIRRRDGMAKLNSSPLAGAITGAAALPLPDLTVLTRHFLAPIDDLEPAVGAGSPTTNTFRHSTDGTTWTTLTTVSSTLAKPGQANQLGTFGIVPELRGSLAFATLNNKFYYPGNDYVGTSGTPPFTPPTIHVWDGTTDYVLCKIPMNANTPSTDVQGNGVLTMIPYSATQLLVTTYDGNGATGRGRVLLLDVTTGLMTQIAPNTDLLGAPTGVLVYQGRIWATTAVSNGTSGLVVVARENDATFATSLTMAVSLGGNNMVSFLGNLYAGSSAGWAASGASSFVKKYTSSTGAWTTVLTNDGTSQGNLLGPLMVTADGLTILCFWSSLNGAGHKIRVMKSTDGSSWSEDLDVGTSLGATYTASGMPYLDGTTIYWPFITTGFTGRIWKRTSAAAWSAVDTGDTGLRGPLGAVSY